MKRLIFLLFALLVLAGCDKRELCELEHPHPETVTPPDTEEGEGEGVIQ